jgi:hypothetical protein
MPRRGPLLGRMSHLFVGWESPQELEHAAGGVPHHRAHHAAEGAVEP